MFNKVILVGNLTRDIELKYTSSGLAIASCGLAVNRKFNTNEGKKEEICFIDISFFNKAAEIANQYLRKGSKVLIEGRLKFDQWQDNNGNNRSKHSVSVETMTMLGSNDFQKSNNNESSYSDYNQNDNFNKNKEVDFQKNNNYQNDINEKSKTDNYQQKNKNEYSLDDNDDEIPF